jgi:hypothetical protein
MDWFENLNAAPRLLLSFAVLIALTIDNPLELPSRSASLRPDPMTRVSRSSSREGRGPMLRNRDHVLISQIDLSKSAAEDNVKGGVR